MDFRADFFQDKGGTHNEYAVYASLGNDTLRRVEKRGFEIHARACGILRAWDDENSTRKVQGIRGT